MTVVHEYGEFYASHDHMPGAENVLRVGGSLTAVSGGWSVALREHQADGNPGFNPLILHLDLVFEGPDDQTSSTKALDAVEVPEYRLEQPLREYTQVQFHVVGTDDDPPPTIDVEHPE